MSEEQTFRCSRCGREQPGSVLVTTQANKLACGPDSDEYDRCMRIWTGQQDA